MASVTLARDVLHWSPQDATYDWWSAALGVELAVPEPARAWVRFGDRLGGSFLGVPVSLNDETESVTLRDVAGTTQTVAVSDLVGLTILSFAPKSA